MRITPLLSVLALLVAAPLAAAPKKPKPPADPAKTEAVLEIVHGGRPLGQIVLRFFPETAPNSVRRFLELSAAGFYDGTHFHRVIPGFMIQGGDPRSKDRDRSRHGTGFAEKNGRPQFLPAEFSGRQHKRGIVSMARGANPESSSSQFFICVADAPHLDRQYNVFGEVVSGLEVADRIVAVPRDGRDNPIEDVVVKSVTLRPAGGAASATASPAAAKGATAAAPAKGATAAPKPTAPPTPVGTAVPKVPPPRGKR